MDSLSLFPCEHVIKRLFSLIFILGCFLPFKLLILLVKSYAENVEFLEVVLGIYNSVCHAHFKFGLNERYDRQNVTTETILSLF